MLSAVLVGNSEKERERKRIKESNIESGRTGIHLEFQISALVKITYAVTDTIGKMKQKTKRRKSKIFS